MPVCRSRYRSNVKMAVRANNEELLSSIYGMIDKISAPASYNANIYVAEMPKLKRKSNNEQFKINLKCRL